MVWGGMKEDGTKILTRYPDRLNSDGYMEVLNKGLLSIYDRNDIFQQDNVRTTNPELYHPSWIIVEYAA